MNEPSDPPRVRPRRPSRLPGPGFLLAVAWVLVLVVAQTVFVTVGFVAGLVTGGGLEGPPLVAIATTGVLLTALLLVGLWYGPDAREKLALRAPSVTQLALVLLLTTPLLLVLGEVTAWLVDAYRAAGVPDRLVAPTELLGYIDAIRQYRTWPAGMAVAFFGALVPAFGEELFFRGFLGRGLLARWGVVGGVLLTALLFGAVHFHLLHSVVTALIGVVLHVVYLWTRSLVVPVALHAAYNAQAILGNVLTRGTRYDTAADEHLPLVLALAALAATAGVAYLLYRSRVRWVRADGTDWSPGFPSAEMPPEGADARLVGDRLRAGPVAVVAVGYLLFVAALGWELAR